MIEVRRDGDSELCGYVLPDEDGAGWRSVTVFGGLLGVHEERADAELEVRDAGLAVLADRWTLHDLVAGEEQVVCIQEASPDGVTLALDYYSLPGVPTLRLTRADLAGGRWRLEHR